MENFNLTLEDIYGITQYENKCKEINWYNRYFTSLDSFGSMFKRLDELAENIKFIEYSQIKENVLKLEGNNNGKYKMGIRR